MQSVVHLEQGFRRQNLLIVHVAERIAAANRGLSIAEHIPSKAEVGSEILPFAVIPGPARRRSREVQGGVREQGLLGTALEYRREFERIRFIHHTGQLVAQAQGHGEIRPQLPLVLPVKGVAVIEEVTYEGGVGDKSRRPAGHIERLAVAIHIAAQGCQQRVGGGEIGAAHARQVPSGERRLPGAHPQAVSGHHAVGVGIAHTHPLRVKAELNVVVAALVSRIVGEVVGISVAALRLKLIHGIGKDGARQVVGAVLL